MMLLVSIIMSIIVSPRLSLVFVVIAPIFVILLGLVIKSASKYFPKIFRGYDRMNQVVRENVRGIREVKTYVQEEAQTVKFKKAAGFIYKLFATAQKIMSLNSMIVMAVLNISNLAFCWFGAKEIVGGSLQTGQLISMFSYSNSVLGSLNMLAMIITQLVVSGASGNRVAAVINEKPSIENPRKPLKHINNGEVIFDHVNFKYDPDDKDLALSNINLNIRPGETVGVIGRTGASKSTLVSMIPRLYDTDSGAVRVSGHNVKSYDLKTLRDNVAMTVAQNITLIPAIQGKSKNLDETAARLLEKVGLNPQEYASRYPRELSGGEQQRIGILRAIASKPPIVLMDEPFSALDPLSRANLQKLVVDLHQQLHNTIIFVTHDMNEALLLADRIGIMKDGQLLQVDKPEEDFKTSCK